MNFLYRSALYVPASNAKALAKVAQLKCDAVIYDLEDAVAPEAKAAARLQLAEHFSVAQSGHQQHAIRINRYTTPWYADDIKLAASLNPDAVVLPKVETAEEIHRTAHDLFIAGCSDRTKLWALIETPKGVLAAPTLAGGSPRLTTLVMGLNDLAKDLHIELTADRMALLHSMCAVVLAARAQGLRVLDGVYPALDDEAGFAQQCQQGRALGFDGKTVIHPNQIASANQFFSPSAAAIAQAQKIAEAWRRGGASGGVVCDGQMIEALHAQQAERTLTLAQLIKDRE